MSLSQYLDRNTRHIRLSSRVQPSSASAYAARSGRTLRRSGIVLLVCLVTFGLVTIGVSVHGHAVAEPDLRGKQTASSVDPRLILQPQTLTQSKRNGGLHLEMTMSPVIPGVNHFALRIDNGSQPLDQEAVTATATMLGMVMRPLHVAFTAGADGRYAATGTLPMFGDWQIALQVRQPHGGTITTLFSLSLGLPAGLYSAPQTKQK